jgi:hypothetical protein
MTEILRRLRKMRFLAAFLALGLLAASCGDSDSTTEADAGSDGAASDEATTEDDGAMAEDEAMAEDDGAMAEDEATAEDDEAMAAMEEAMANADLVIEAEVTDGAVVVEQDRYPVAVGSAVYIGVRSDTADEVHVHGYDLLSDVAPDHPATIEFVADAAGLFEVELEGSGTLLFELEVS